DAQASCAANAIVNALGVSKIRAYQLVTADDKANSESLGQARLSTGDATKVVDGIFTCVGGATIARLMTHVLQTSMPSTVTLRVRTCMERKITPAVLREFAITQLSGGNVETSSFMLSLQKCAA
ncbi:MAG TPA: hypothetical protein VN108_09680, partial [Marmoricola sp.]|nr:hypothetical protein [Marmoricola sp.]